MKTMDISHNPPCFALIFHIIPMLDVLGMGIWNHRMGVRAAGGLCVIPASFGRFFGRL